MRTFRILWKNIFIQSKILILLLIISSSVYALSIIPMWLQKEYLENVELFMIDQVTLSSLLISLFILYLFRSITGGFLIPFGHAKDLYYEYILTRNVLLSQHEINNKIFLEYYESAPVYNLLTRAKTALTTGALRGIVNTVSAILTLGLSLLAMIGSLYLLNPLFALISVVSIIPIFVEQLVFADKFVQLQKKITEKRRKQEQCVKHIIGKEYYLETRISGVAKYFRNKWESYRQEIEQEEMKLQFSRLKFELIFNLIKSISVVGIIVLAAAYMSEGIISIGTFSAVVSILSVMHASTGFFISRISSMYAQYKELTDVTQYYELDKEAESRKSVPTIDTIKLENISFKYPERETFAVKNINQQFSKGEKIAILGVNGAGKTTLINLILGLYRPTEGTVFYGDVDISNVTKSNLYNKMAAVFQDFGVYNLTIKDNVKLGDIEKIYKDTDIYEALSLAGFNYQKYHEQAETFIGREFNGIGLSRGEAQQLAIARSYFNKRANIFIIDEPTAALDPIAEEKLYKKFLHITGDKTTFFISHRLGSVRIADRILVMDSAEIIEDGTHDELLRQNGLYAQMYRKQAALYDR